MIARDKPNVWELIGVWRLSILPHIAPQLACSVLWSCFIVWIGTRLSWATRGWTVAPFTLLGVALSIFLGFRSSACYDRWWEARRRLGALVAETRSFARLCVNVPRLSPAVREALLGETIAFAYALMRSLRKVQQPSRTSQAKATSRNAPDLVLRKLGRLVAEQLGNGTIGEPLYKLLEERLIAFAGIQAACERIQSTPTPLTYTLLVDRTAYAYCFLLPFGLATTMGWVTPLFVALVAYASLASMHWAMNWKIHLATMLTRCPCWLWQGPLKSVC
jgi:ion channel-forming bestrophin family protein